jgi:hypothetical protein
MSASPLTRAWYPPCFDDRRQYARWQSMHSKTKEVMRAGYCADCTCAYQRRMISQGRCTHPEMSLEDAA